MLLRQWLGSLDSRQRVAIVAVVALVLSAGCLGLGDSGDSGPEMNDDGSVDDPGENNSDQTGEGNNTDDLIPYEDADEWQSQYDEFGDADDVAVDALVNRTISESRAVESYEYTRSTTVWEVSGDQQAQTSFEDETAIDVVGQTLQYTRSVTRGNSTTSYEGYLSNGTLYEYSERYQQQSPTGWIRQNLSGNYENTFSRFDVVVGLVEGLQNGTISVAGTGQVAGQSTTVLQVSLDNSSLGQPEQGAATLTDSRVLLWISGSDRVLRAATYSAFESQSQGTTASSTIVNEFNFEYTDVSISIPDEADTAVPVGP